MSTSWTTRRGQTWLWLAHEWHHGPATRFSPMLYIHYIFFHLDVKIDSRTRVVRVRSLFTSNIIMELDVRLDSAFINWSCKLDGLNTWHSNINAWMETFSVCIIWETFHVFMDTGDASLTHLGRPVYDVYGNSCTSTVSLVCRTCELFCLKGLKCHISPLNFHCLGLAGRPPGPS